MLKVIAKSELKPGSWDTVTPMYRELIEKTRQEDGCIEYGLYIDLADENKCTFIEEWASEEALAAHVKSEHFTRIFPQLREYTVGQMEVSRYRAL